jgi:hypothetical protein
MEKMDRGDCTDTCRAHLGNTTKFNVRQTRRGWLQELIGCDAKSEFSYFNAMGTKVATSLEESGWCCRVCCTYVLLLVAWFLALSLVVVVASDDAETPIQLYPSSPVDNHTCGHTFDAELAHTS